MMFQKLFLGIATISTLTLSSGCNELQSILGSNGSTGTALTDGQIASGLKEALTQGVSKGVSLLSAENGFFGNALLKILLPPEAHKVEKTLRDVGMGKFVDDAVLKMNRAAEDASKGAKDIFVTAITSMTISDAMSILMGEKNSCTNYLKKTCATALYDKCQPVIKSSLDKVGAVKAWKEAVTQYNKIPLVQKQEPDIDKHVTTKAIDGLFHMVEKEEGNIRANPAARVTDLLQKVFAKQDPK